MDKFTNSTFKKLALADGNEVAFDALFVEYYPKVLQFAMRFCHDKSEEETLSRTYLWNYGSSENASQKLRILITIYSFLLAMRRYVV